MSARNGTIYLLHYSDPIGDPQNPRGQARHYLGWCESRRLDTRLGQHADGRGAALTRAFVRAGRVFVLARTWKGTRDDERRLKNRKEAPKLCPYCKGRYNLEQFAEPPF
jgi:putative endonuclease